MKEKLPSISKKVWCRPVRPTFSRSLCLPPARTHFCAVAARLYSRRSSPRNTPLNCTMPALVNSRVGSWAGTRGDERTTVCPWRRKYSRKRRRSSPPVMVMASLYRGSVGWCVPVGPRPRERRDRPHNLRQGVSAAHEVVAQSGRRPWEAGPQQGRQPATTGLETALGLRRLLEGGGDRRGGHVAGNALLEELPAETAAADAAPTGARLGPEARKGGVVHVASGGELGDDRAGDFVGCPAAPEPPGQLAGAPGLACEKVEGRQLGGLRVQLPPLPGPAPRAADPRRHDLRPAWRGPAACRRSARPRSRGYPRPRSSHPSRRCP